jgi:GTP-binding protein
VRIRDARIVATAVGPAGFPRDGLPEVAFLGRSNAGKSSLLNALVGRRELARVSATPGKTRALHFYRVEALDAEDRPLTVRFVDLPGYGFARVAKSERAAWRRLVESYLGDRPQLRLAVLIQDVRRDASDDELDLVAWLGERAVPVVVVASKADKLGSSARAERLRVLRAAYGPGARVLAASARTRLGLPELWALVADLARFGSDAAPGAGAGAHRTP